MKTQITRTGMLAEEMTRTGIRSILDGQLSYQTDFRLLEFGLKAPVFNNDRTRIIEVSGWVDFTHYWTDQPQHELAFAGRMTIEKAPNSGEWRPSFVSLTLYRDVYRDIQLGHVDGQCALVSSQLKLT